MFSGIIKSTGKIKNIKKNIKNIELQILSKLKLKKKISVHQFAVPVPVLQLIK